MESSAATNRSRRRRRHLEKRTSVSYRISSSHPIANENTVPANPGLLSATTIGNDKNLAPAAFPSLSFKRPRTNSERCLKDSAPSKRDRFSVTSRSLVSLEHQNDRPRHDFRSSRKTTEAIEIEDVEMRSDGLLDQAVIHTMQTSPILAPIDLNTHEEPQISWNRIELGLQLYIFDNLLQQFQQPWIVADILGLNSNDVRTLARVKNQRVLQPETTEELWEHCRLLGDETKAFIDPRILKGHLDYFAYVSQFEGVSAIQRRTAVVFLRQRQIEGAFVEALLQEETGIWSRPDYREEDQLHDATGSNMVTHDDEAEWPSALSKISVDDSHDLDMIVSGFRSCYLPSNIRNDLLTKPVQDLSAFETWLIYASIPSDTTNSELGGKQLDSDSLGLQSVVDPALFGLSISLSHQAQEGDGSIGVSPDSSTNTHSILYTIARSIHQSRTVRQKIEQMPLTRQQKIRVLEVAEEHQKSMLADYLKPSSHESHESHETHETHGHRATDPSTPTSTTPEYSTPLTEHSRLLQSMTSGGFPSDTITSSSSDLNRGYSSVTSLETAHTSHPLDGETIPSQGASKKRRDTVSTNATLVLTNQKPTYRAPDASNNSHAEELPRHDSDRSTRALSQESYHTAPDLEGNDAEASIATHEVIRRTPSPPPWSPITEEDREIREVSSPSFLISAHGTAIIGLGLDTLGGQPTFEGAMTYNGDMPNSRSPPIFGNGDQADQADQASDIPVSQTLSEILYGIHGAVTSPTPSPTATAILKTVSTNNEFQPPPSRKPLPPLPPPVSQHDHSNPSEPPKKKQRTTATPQARDQPSPGKPTPNLKLRTSALASGSSSESTSPSRTTSSPSPKKIRSDKGKKRGPYNMKKNKLAIRAEAGVKEMQTSTGTDREAGRRKKKESNANKHSNTPSQP